MTKNAWDDVLDPNEKYKYLESVSKTLSSFHLGLEIRGFKDLVTMVNATKIVVDDEIKNHVS